ncbi:hypothetical protein BX257_4726 [Streptomyces sp. 3212.3]|uniref:hypothetical protein n=1 Tax=Streptomyces sp. 3212.3 TaxID=1938846 RepID=UPI000E22185A|nr:hypothetical protein [Streptomyces sp. 3212.3]REE62113.1 hypothetical protein BX257_4726 [Streptomyces sp. 3212.3]
MRISRVWKAVVAGVTAGAAAAGTAVQDGQLTLAEGITIVLALAGGYGVTWRVPNRQPADER